MGTESSAFDRRTMLKISTAGAIYFSAAPGLAQPKTHWPVHIKRYSTGTAP